jgi:hypothetical protein
VVGQHAESPLCFVPTVHEVENYLLDAAALAGCVFNTGDRTPESIGQRMRKEAGRLVWWMACRAVIAGFHDEFSQDFPEHPKCDAVTDQATASNYIASQEWYKKLGQRAKGATGAGEVESRLRAAHKKCAAQLKSGAWKQTFSGKEIFRPLRDWVYTKRPPNASGSDLDVSVAKAIAAWQVQSNSVPQEVRDLRAAIRQRAGLP